MQAGIESEHPGPTDAEGPADRGCWPCAGRHYRRHSFSPEIEAELRLLNVSDNYQALVAIVVNAAWFAACIALCLCVSAWWCSP